MKLVLMLKQYLTIVSGEEVLKPDCTEEARLAFLNRSQNAVYAITMDVSDHCLGWTTDAESPTYIWRELRDKYHIYAEAKIDVLLIEYHLVYM